MGRTVAVVWHASFSVLAAVLYFFFVLPRWWELTGAAPQLLGTVMRIVAAVLIALAALPVVFTLLRTRKPEYGTPQLALTLRTASIVAHVLAGVLIAGTAISEIWLSLDRAGQWLFGIYGAAAAIALLGIAAFALSFLAELPPPPPKPLKPKKQRQRRRSRRKDAEAETAADDGAPESDSDDAAGDDADTEVAEATETPATEPPAESDAELTSPALAATSEQPKRRPFGKRQAKGSD